MRIQTKFLKNEILEKNVCALLTNGRGAMALARAEWAALKTKYDSFLAANLLPNCPTDKYILLTRCRAWLKVDNLIHEIKFEDLISFEKVSNNLVRWLFSVPVNQKILINFKIELELVEGANVSIIKICRLQSTNFVDCNANCQKNIGQTAQNVVKLLIRTDLESRSAHEVTVSDAQMKADYENAVVKKNNGFIFQPQGKPEFQMFAQKGNFCFQPEWIENVHLPEETERCLPDHTDLFSPGFFSFELEQEMEVELVAGNGKYSGKNSFHKSNCLFKDAIKQFIVKRDDSLTVLAGYPWFLDWGRDTLIALRGIIAAGFLDEAKEILTQFARFEKNGTLPNMIRGDDQSNRDTSDAPLWFFVACADLIKAEGHTDILNENCGGRLMRDVLKSIIINYISGTPNKIKMDEDSGLIFSPTHFTWMDTNHPAGTPRQGYPIEVQALWFFCLNFYHEISGEKIYKKLAGKVVKSIELFFTGNGNNCLSDCLHCDFDVPAREAKADDAIRPNQLLAITLGAIKNKILCEKILAKTKQLLVPGAIRSLANIPLKYPLPIYHNGKLMNNPRNPYRGEYTGDEDTSRKLAYHNGTAWTWLFPSYVEAMLMTSGESCLKAAREILRGSEKILNEGCIMQIPEILDGDFPHKQKGCCAQAWGITELYRALLLTEKF